MERMNEKEAKAVARLSSESDFQVYISWLDRSLQAFRRDSDNAEDITEIRQSQGRRQILARLLEDIAESKNTMERFEQNKDTNDGEYYEKL